MELGKTRAKREETTVSVDAMAGRPAKVERLRWGFGPFWLHFGFSLKVCLRNFESRGGCSRYLLFQVLNSAQDE